MSSNTNEKSSKNIKCYICGVDLMQEWKKEESQQKNNSDIKQQNDLNETPQHFPTMTRFDGQKKELCGSCFKNYLGGIKIYQEKHPEWQPPKPSD